MRKFLCAFSCVALLALPSCKKETGISNQGKPPATSPSTYRSVPESELKGIARTVFDSPNPTAAQLARRAKNNKMIKEMGLPVLETLPVVEDEQLVKLRTPQEAAE